MANEVLIAAAEAAARTPAEVARSLQLKPVVAASEQEALALLDRGPFELIAVSSDSAWRRVRVAAAKKQPSARIVDIPESDGDDLQLRGLMIRSFEPRSSRRFSEERYRFLSGILETFTATLELKEVLRRIVTTTREEFGADRAWLLHPATGENDLAKVAFATAAPGIDADPNDRAPVSLVRSQNLIRRAMESPRPIVTTDRDPDLDPEYAEKYAMRSQMLQILRPREGQPFAFGIHQTTDRVWTEEEIDLFAEIGRYATLALNNTLLHDKAVREMAKVSAILDQIPEAAAIFDASGKLERTNAAAQRETVALFGADAEGRVREYRHRYVDGDYVEPAEMPPMRALGGDIVRSDYVLFDPKSGDDRVVNVKAAPIRDDAGKIIGSVVLSRDVTEERQNAEREAWRRRRAECLASLGLESVTVQPAFEGLDEQARRIANAVDGTVRIYLYNSGTGLLNLVGFSSTLAQVQQFQPYFADHPYRPGEGLPGTVFQIGRPLFFYEVRGDSLIDFGRDEEEKAIKAAMREHSVIASPIESYGDRIGAFVISQSDPRRNFDAEDLEFAQSVAERIGAAAHIHHLTRIAQEGHRAADELARREVDARVRFEAVLENAPVGVAVISADELRFELANPRFNDFALEFGKVSADTRIVGLRVEEVIPDFDKTLKQVADTGETRIDEAVEIAARRGPLYANRIISAVRGRFSGITQSLTVLLQDVTEQVVEERQKREREAWRRRRAECLAGLGLESVSVQPVFGDLDEPARRVAEAVGGTAMIYLYHHLSGELHVVGFASVAENAESFAAYRDHLARSPYRPGEGLPGTVFQIGRPLLFSDVRGNAVIDFGRDDVEKSLIAALREESLIASPIESYGDRIGAIVIARSDSRRDFDAEDLEFAQSVAERIGAAAHIHRLTRIAQEGHRAAEELARREVDARVRFEAVLENAPVGVAVISADELRFELANPRFIDFAAQFGKISDDTKIIGLRAADVIPDFEGTLKHVAESGDTQIDEAFEVAGGLQPLYVTRIVSAVRGRFSGITQNITVLVQDVTEQVRAKREIEDLARMMAERSARLDSILGSMTDGLWVYDAAGKLVDVNQAALTLFGLGSRADAVQHESFQAFSLRYPDGKPIPPPDFPHARALRGHTVPDYLAIGRHLLTGRDLDLSIAAAPIESNGVVGAVLVIRDITALQELDRKKDEFLSVASHELRTPLTTIKGYTQLLVQAANDLGNDDRTTYLNAVLSEVERMMGLISELLDVSRIETNRLQIHPQPIRWADFVERRVTAFRIQHPGRTIRFDVTAANATVMADPDRMRQVIDNLLSNAIKYSPEGTDIEVEATLDSGFLLTSVIDHGIGIPRDEIPQLFERFHRARNVSSRYYGGLGLGLYIAKAIIEVHHGSIHVESQEGEGSRFTIRLPLPHPNLAAAII